MALHKKDDIKLLLPWPPSVNHYWRTVLIPTKRGKVPRTLISKEGRIFRRNAFVAIKKQYPICEVIRDRCQVHIYLKAPDERRRDIDNYVKAVLDVLTHANVLEDDVLVDELIVQRGLKEPGGAAIVSVRRLGGR